MSRTPKPHRILVLALLALVFLLPALATAAPHHSEAVPVAAARHDAGPSLLLAQLQGFLSFLWKNGSGLDPDGRPGPNPPATTAGDTGSGLEPNG